MSLFIYDDIGHGQLNMQLNKSDGDDDGGEEEEEEEEMKRKRRKREELQTWSLCWLLKHFVSRFFLFFPSCVGWHKMAASGTAKMTRDMISILAAWLTVRKLVSDTFKI